MPNTARILRFPTPEAVPLTTSEAMAAARLYVASFETPGIEARRISMVVQPDVLMSICAMLRQLVDGSAQVVLKESEALYRCIAASDRPLGSFDEKDYFSGETALIAATASRVLGRRAETESWLDRAEAGFRHTLNPAPLLASVTYQRLALRCEVGRHEEVAELAPLLAASFGRFNMTLEQAKCVFLQGVALKQSGKHNAAVACFESLREAAVSERDPGLIGLGLTALAEIHMSEGRDELAADCCGEAMDYLERAKRPAAVAHLRALIGETFRRQGRLSAALEAYRAAIEAYHALGMSTWVAYLQVVLAQVLIEAGQFREAEWQILAALPTIDEQKMVPEGFAAVALLRESVRQRQTDPKALLELREYLQAKN